MSEPISWKAIDDKEKVRLVLEHVMGYFILEETAKGYHTPEFSKDKPAPVGFHWPIAFWNTDGEVWVYRDIADNNVTFFDPLHDWNDTWKIVRQVNKPSPGYQIYADFIDNLQSIIGSNMFFDLFYCDPDGDHLTPERICIAVLQAVGCEVLL